MGEDSVELDLIASVKILIFSKINTCSYEVSFVVLQIVSLVYIKLKIIYIKMYFGVGKNTTTKSLLYSM